MGALNQRARPSWGAAGRALKSAETVGKPGGVCDSFTCFACLAQHYNNAGGGHGQVAAQP